MNTAARAHLNHSIELAQRAAKKGKSFPDTFREIFLGKLSKEQLDSWYRPGHVKLIENMPTTFQRGVVVPSGVPRPAAEKLLKLIEPEPGVKAEPGEVLRFFKQGGKDAARLDALDQLYDIRGEEGLRMVTRSLFEADPEFWLKLHPATRASLSHFDPTIDSALTTFTEEVTRKVGEIAPGSNRPQLVRQIVQKGLEIARVAQPSLHVAHGAGYTSVRLIELALRSPELLLDAAKAIKNMVVGIGKGTLTGKASPFIRQPLGGLTIKAGQRYAEQLQRGEARKALEEQEKR